MKDSIDLNFDKLCLEVLNSWPERIKFGEIIFQGAETKGYLVQGLFNVHEDVENKYIGTEHEVLLRTLSWDIYKILHSIAKYTQNIDRKQLRIESIRRYFEESLREILSINHGNWSPEDMYIIELYFAKNKST